MTGGECFPAGSAEALNAAYRKLGSRLQTRTRDTELTALLALLAATLIAAGASLSVLWFGPVA